MAGIGNHQTCGHVKRCSLACTIGAQQTDNLSLADIEGDIVDHRSFAINFHEPLTSQLERQGFLRLVFF